MIDDLNHYHLKSSSIHPHLLSTNSTDSMDQEEDTFTSVTWADNGNHHPNGQGSAVIQSSSNPSSPSRQRQPLTHARNASTDAHRQIGGLQTGLGAIGRSESARALSRAANDVEPPKWEGYLMVQVTDPRKELENTKEMFISYGIRAEVSCNRRQVQANRMTWLGAKRKSVSRNDSAAHLQHTIFKTKQIEELGSVFEMQLPCPFCMKSACTHLSLCPSPLNSTSFLFPFPPPSLSRPTSLTSTRLV